MNVESRRTSSPRLRPVPRPGQISAGPRHPKERQGTKRPSARLCLTASVFSRGIAYDFASKLLLMRSALDGDNARVAFCRDVRTQPLCVLPRRANRVPADSERFLSCCFLSVQFTKLILITSGNMVF